MAQLPAFTQVGPYDRPGLATYNLTRGDPAAAWRSLIDPQSLSPEERAAAGDHWYPKGDDAFSRVLRAVANPLVVLGAVLAMRFPYPSAKNMFKWSEQVAGYEKALAPVIWRIQDARYIFKGTKFLTYFERLLDDVKSFKTAVTEKWATGLFNAETSLGRSTTLKEHIASFAEMGKLYGSDNKKWAMVRGLIEKYRKAGALSAEEVAELGDLRGIGELRSPGALRAMANEDAIAGAKEGLGKARTMIQETWEAATDKKKMREKFFDRLDKMGIDADEEADYMGLVTQGEKGLREKGFKFREDYVPYVSNRTPSQEEEIQRMMLRSGSRTRPSIRPSTHALEFNDQMLPSLEDFREIQEAYTPQTGRALELVRQARIRYAGVKNAEYEAAGNTRRLLPHREFSMRLPGVMEHYTHTMGTTYGWLMRGHGPMLEMEAETIRRVGDPVKARIAEESLIPLAKGRLTPGEAMNALGWSSLKHQAKEFFQNEHVQMLLGGTRSEGGHITSPIADWFVEQMGKPAIQNLTARNAGAKLAGYLYYSTLGMNVPSAALNLMQNLVTTSGMIEGKHLWSGLRLTLAPIDQFVNMTVKGGVPLEQAFSQLWPEYSVLGSPSEIEALTAVRRALAGGGPIRAKMETVKAAMMSMFTATERFNKLWAFNSSRIKAVADGLAKHIDDPEAMNFGKEIVNITQFPGGPLNTPVGFLGLSPPLRMFSQFPSHMAQLLFGYGTTLGSGENAFKASFPLVGGRNFGTAGRLLLASGGIAAAGSAMGWQVPGILEGLPLPHGEDQPGFPFPFMPPALAVPGAVVADVLTGGGDEGDFARTRRAASSLVPGGVALSRLSTIMAPQLAEALGREYVDWDAAMPDGTLPIFSPSGSLKGYKRPMRIVADALGWKTLTGDPEGELSSFLVKNRDRIRGYRRDYIEAIARNQPDRAMAINEEYKKAYPQLGDIAIKKTDIQAVHLRHDMSRIERILQTMPPDSRTLFGQMITVGLGDSAETFLGVDPALFSGEGTRTAAQRDQYRRRPEGPAFQRAKQQGVGPIRMDQTGEENRGLSPFAPFGGY